MNYLMTYLKGFLMGTCDVVPGVSGGTIAFITGIYHLFIQSIKNITSKESFLMIMSLLKFDFKTFKKYFLELKFDFLLTLLIGIASGIFLVSKLILYLIDNYGSFTFTFFIGLILSSSFLIFKEIENHKKINYLFAFVGFLVGLSMIFLNTNSVINPNLMYIILGGFLAISAMFLPGISGSFILLVLGLYEVVYGALHDITNQYNILIYFLIGLLIGMIFISRLIDFLFKWDKSKTLYFLLGLIWGAIFVPVELVIQNLKIDIINLALIFICFAVGVLSVFLADYISIKLNKNKKN